MEIDSTIVPFRECGEWDAFVRESPLGSVFAGIPWLDIVERMYGAPVRLCLTTVDGEITAATPFHTVRERGLTAVPTYPVTPYTGLLLRPGLKEPHYHDAARAHLRTLAQQAERLSFTLSPALTDTRPYLWEGWRVSPLYTYVVDMADEEAVWEGFSQSLRRKIRRADESGLRMVRVEDASRIYALHAHSYARHESDSPMREGAFARWFEAITASGIGSAYGAESADGELLSVRVVLRDGIRTYDWLAGAGAESEEHNATHWLVWEIMKELRKGGVERFDFRGANTAGIIDFKRLFGGALLPYYHVTIGVSRLAKLSDAALLVLRGLRR